MRSKWKIVVALFTNGGGYAGSFRSPPPGTSTENPPEDGYEVGMKIDDLDDPIARKNFRVIVIRPFEVEATDLNDPAKARRQLYTYHSNDRSWSHEELWP
jgi:pyridoxamine 5'-phosphate oxidase